MSRRPTLAGLTLLAVLAIAAPVAADAGTWHSPPCATGMIASHGVSSGNGGVTIEVTGDSTPCPDEPDRSPAERPYEFGLIVYTAGDAYIGRISRYQSAAGPTGFRYVVDYTGTTLRHGPITALCLAYGPGQRLACLAVTTVRPAEPPVLTGIPTIDIRVSDLPIQHCGTCVTWPPVWLS